MLEPICTCLYGDEDPSSVGTKASFLLGVVTGGAIAGPIGIVVGGLAGYAAKNGRTTAAVFALFGPWIRHSPRAASVSILGTAARLVPALREQAQACQGQEKAVVAAIERTVRSDPALRRVWEAGKKCACCKRPTCPHKRSWG
jgi:hypothetical protein